MFETLRNFFRRQISPMHHNESVVNDTFQPTAQKKDAGTTAPDKQVMQEDEQEDPDFMGIHFEGLGDVWGSLFPDGSKAISECIALATSSGTLQENCQVIYQENKTHVALIQAPEKGDIQSAVLLVKKEDMQDMHVWSGYPLLQGVPNRLEITKVHTWSNGVEGVVAAEAGQGGPPVTFFAPFYFRDSPKFLPGMTFSISLAALAFHLKKAQDITFPVETGPFYDLKLEEFLKENPGKVAADFIPPDMTFAGASILLPATYVCEWRYRVPVLSIDYVEFMGNRFTKIGTTFVGCDEDTIHGNLYAADHILQGYAPQVGDDIEGVLWMTGVLQEENLTNKRTDSACSTSRHESEEEIIARKLSQSILAYLNKRTVAEIATIYAKMETLDKKNNSGLSQYELRRIQVVSATPPVLDKKARCGNTLALYPPQMRELCTTRTLPRKNAITFSVV